MNELQINLVSKYRTKLMGIAAVGILAIHSIDYGIPYNNLLRNILHMGLHGVDMFLLLSGLGLYYAMQKKTSLVTFYKKRLFRVLLPYIIMAIPLLAISNMLSGNTPLQYVLDVSTLSYWMSRRGAWYVAMLIPLYLIYPFIYKLISKSKSQMIILLVIVSGLSYFCDSIDKGMINVAICESVLFVLRRLASFFVGWMMALVIEDKYWSILKNKSLWIGILAVIMWMVSVKFGIVILMSEYCWFALGACLLGAIIFELCSKVEWIEKITRVFALIGKMSLEMYLANIFCVSIFEIILSDRGALATQYGLIILVGTALAAVVNYILVPFIQKRITRQKG